MVGWWTTSSSSGLKEMVEGKEKEKPQIFTFFLNRGNTFILLGTSALRGLGLWESHDRWGLGGCAAGTNGVAAGLPSVTVSASPRAAL